MAKTLIKNYLRRTQKEVSLFYAGVPLNNEEPL